VHVRQQICYTIPGDEGPFTTHLFFLIRARSRLSFSGTQKQVTWVHYYRYSTFGTTCFLHVVGTRVYSTHCCCFKEVNLLHHTRSRGSIYYTLFFLIGHAGPFTTGWFLFDSRLSSKGVFERTDFRDGDELGDGDNRNTSPGPTVRARTGASHKTKITSLVTRRVGLFPFVHYSECRHHAALGFGPFKRRVSRRCRPDGDRYRGYRSIYFHSSIIRNAAVGIGPFKRRESRQLGNVVPTVMAISCL